MNAMEPQPAPGDAGRLIGWAAKLIADARRVGVQSEIWHNEQQDWFSAYKAADDAQPAPELAEVAAALRDALGDDTDAEPEEGESPGQHAVRLAAYLRERIDELHGLIAGDRPGPQPVPGTALRPGVVYVCPGCGAEDDDEAVIARCVARHPQAGPQPAPGCPDPSQHVVIRDFLTGRELPHAETDGQQPAPGVTVSPEGFYAWPTPAPAQPAPELAAAPELRAAMRETSKVQDVAARMLSWFGGDGTRRHARVTRAQLAHAYRDSGLTVPEELRRFL